MDVPTTVLCGTVFFVGLGFLWDWFFCGIGFFVGLGFLWDWVFCGIRFFVGLRFVFMIVEDLATLDLRFYRWFPSLSVISMNNIYDPVNMLQQ